MVEGSDDKWALINLLARRGVDFAAGDRAPFVRECGGLDPLLDSLGTQAKSTARLAVVLDADDDLAARWAAVVARLAAIDVVLPPRPDPLGTVVRGHRQDWIVGVWLMPDNATSGALEHLLAELIPDDDQPWAYAERAVQEARRLGAPVSARDTLKARMHTWLAWQETPGLPYGTAITAGYLDRSRAPLDAFEHWFSTIFPQKGDSAAVSSR